MKKKKINSKSKLITMVGVGVMILFSTLNISSKNSEIDLYLNHFDTRETSEHGYKYRYEKTEQNFTSGESGINLENYYDEFNYDDDKYSFYPLYKINDDRFDKSVDKDETFPEGKVPEDLYKLNQLNKELMPKKGTKSRYFDNIIYNNKSMKINSDPSHQTDEEGIYDIEFNEVATFEIPDYVKEITNIDLNISVDDFVQYEPDNGDQWSGYFNEQNFKDDTTNISINSPKETYDYIITSDDWTNSEEVLADDSQYYFSNIDGYIGVSDKYMNDHVDGKDHFDEKIDQGYSNNTFYTVEGRNNHGRYNSTHFMGTLKYNENNEPIEYTLWVEEFGVVNDSEWDDYAAFNNCDTITWFYYDVDYNTDEKDLSEIRQNEFDIEEIESNFLLGIQELFLNQNSRVVEEGDYKEFIENLTYGDVHEIILHSHDDPKYSIISYNNKKFFSDEIELEYYVDDKWHKIDEINNQKIGNSSIKIAVCAKNEADHYGYHNNTENIDLELIIPGFGINIDKIINSNSLVGSSINPDFKIKVNEETKQQYFNKSINLDLYTNTNLKFSIFDDAISQIVFDGKTLESDNIEWNFETNFDSGYQIDKQTKSLDINYSTKKSDSSTEEEMVKLYTISVNIYFMEGTPIHSDGNSNGFKVKNGINESNYNYDINQVVQYYDSSNKRQLANLFFTDKNYMEIIISDYEKELIESTNFYKFNGTSFIDTNINPFENSNSFKMYKDDDSSINKVTFLDIYGTTYTYYFIMCGNDNEYNFVYNNSFGTLNPIFEEGTINSTQVENYWKTDFGASTLETLNRKGIYEYELIFSLQDKEIMMFENLPNLYDLKNLIINVEEFVSITSTFHENDHIVFEQLEPLIIDEISNQIWNQTSDLYGPSKDLNGDGDIEDIVNNVNESDFGLDINQDGDTNDIVDHVNESEIYPYGLEYGVDYTLTFDKITDSTIITNSTLIHVKINSTVVGNAYNSYSFEFYPTLKQPVPFWVIFLITFIIIIVIVTISLIIYGLYRRKKMSGRIKI